MSTEKRPRTRPGASDKPGDAPTAAWTAGVATAAKASDKARDCGIFDVAGRLRHLEAARAAWASLAEDAAASPTPAYRQWASSNAVALTAQIAMLKAAT